jgi:hypothetical protein
MKSWLRSVVPDLFLAAVVALLVTLAVQYFDGAEVQRNRTDLQAASENGLTVDERIEVLDSSIRRSTLIQLPCLIALAGVLVGLTCRNRRWAWLTAIGAALPALIMGIAFFIDRPIPAGALTVTYMSLAIATAMTSSAVRHTVLTAWARREPDG